jgi:hypothetical protein
VVGQSASAHFYFGASLHVEGAKISEILGVLTLLRVQEWKMFYVESYITMGIRVILWLNVPVVEKKLRMQRKRGKWPANQTRRENAPNSQSVYTSAAEKASGKS